MPAIPEVIKTKPQSNSERTTEAVPMLASAVYAIDFMARIIVPFNHFKTNLLFILFPPLTEYAARTNPVPDAYTT